MTFLNSKFSLRSVQNFIILHNITQTLVCNCPAKCPKTIRRRSDFFAIWLISGRCNAVVVVDFASFCVAATTTAVTTAAAVATVAAAIPPTAAPAAAPYQHQQRLQLHHLMRRKTASTTTATCRPRFLSSHRQ